MPFGAIYLFAYVYGAVQASGSSSFISLEQSFTLHLLKEIQPPSSEFEGSLLYLYNFSLKLDVHLKMNVTIVQLKKM